MHQKKHTRTTEKQQKQVDSCLNCSCLAWMVGIGLGARCKHPENKTASWRKETDSQKLVDNVGPLIPSRSFLCGYHTPKNSETKKREEDIT